jgi:phage terminase Nu1 subunit (DNA packaging protein)
LPTPDKDGYDALTAIKALIQHYKARNEQARDIAAEKLRLTKEQADKVALDNQERQGRLVDVRIIAETVNDSLRSMRAAVLASDLDSDGQDAVLKALQNAYEMPFLKRGAVDTQV